MLEEPKQTRVILNLPLGMKSPQGENRCLFVQTVD